MTSILPRIARTGPALAKRCVAFAGVSRACPVCRISTKLPITWMYSFRQYATEAPGSVNTPKVEPAKGVVSEEPARVQAVDLATKKPRKPRTRAAPDPFQKLDPRVKAFLKWFGLASIGGAAALIAYEGRPFESDFENKFKDLDMFSAWFKRLKVRLEDHLQFFTEPPSDKLLPDKNTIPVPPEGPTLVISLDDTLVYSRWDREHGWRVAKRPGFDYFLCFLAALYESVIWTSQPSYTGELLFNKVDPLGLAPERLYREHLRYVEGKYIKDVTKLNRDPASVIVMDSNPEAFSLQPENGLYIPPWNGDPNDTYLIDIIPFLEHFYFFRIQDVRPVLKNFQNKDIPTAYKEWEENWMNQSRLEWERSKQKKGLASLTSMFGGGHVPEQVIPRHERIEAERKILRDDINANFAKYLQERPETYRKMMEEREYFDRLQTQHIKDSNMTIWQLMTQGPPPPPPELMGHAQLQPQPQQQPQQQL